MQSWQLGSYEIVRQLGEGGMAQVYLARDVRLGREVAIKVLDQRLAERPGFRERYLREAQVAAALDHPHIVPLYDFGESNGLLYLVMPYLSGGSLQDMLPKTPLPAADVVTYGTQMADALAYAHERGVVHRDVKPANMLLHADGRLMLSDFGLAKILSPSSRPSAPRNHPDAGTPEYMAPEQIEGRTDERSDIYALGVVLYLLLTGHLPFAAPTSSAVMEGHLFRLPEEPRRLNPGISPAMQTVILQAMAKHPADRFQRVTELGAALLSALVAGDAEPLPFLLSNPTPAPLNTPTPVTVVQMTPPTVDDTSAPAPGEPREQRKATAPRMPAINPDALPRLDRVVPVAAPVYEPRDASPRQSLASAPPASPVSPLPHRITVAPQYQGNGVLPAQPAPASPALPAFPVAPLPPMGSPPAPLSPASSGQHGGIMAPQAYSPQRGLPSQSGYPVPSGHPAHSGYPAQSGVPSSHSGSGVFPQPGYGQPFAHALPAILDDTRQTGPHAAPVMAPPPRPIERRGSKVWLALLVIILAVALLGLIAALVEHLMQIQAQSVVAPHQTLATLHIIAARFL